MVFCCFRAIDPHLLFQFGRRNRPFVADESEDIGLPAGEVGWISGSHGCCAYLYEKIERGAAELDIAPPEEADVVGYGEHDGEYGFLPEPGDE